MQDRISAKEYNAMAAKPSKMRNIKTMVDGRIFDSQKEADYYCQLKILKRHGEIIDFLPQVSFLIHEGYYKGGHWIKPIYYKADFVVITHWMSPFKVPCVIIEIHEVKGRWTQVAINARKMFEKRYPDYKFVVI